MAFEVKWAPGPQQVEKDPQFANASASFCDKFGVSCTFVSGAFFVMCPGKVFFTSVVPNVSKMGQSEH